MNEPDVTLTDYGLAILCAVLAWRVITRARAEIRPWLAVFFLGPGAAALFGGTVHGFFEDVSTLGYRLLWPATLLSMGATASAAWGLGARVGDHAAGARRITLLAAIGFLAFAAVVLSGTHSFGIAVAYYLPAVVFLSVRFVMAWRRDPTPGRKAAIVGLALTFVAAAVQQLRIPLHPTYFDHNALYHVIQAVAFVLFYRGAVAE